MAIVTVFTAVDQMPSLVLLVYQLDHRLNISVVFSL